MSEIIRLQPYQIKFADEIGAWRRQQAIEKDRHRVKGDIVQTIEDDILGARCECAAYLYFDMKVKWYRKSEEVDATLPDFTTKNLLIDAKGVAKNRLNLIVKQRGHLDWAYLLILGENHPDYKIAGWTWGKDVMKREYWRSDIAAPAFICPQKDLRQASELYNLVMNK